MSKNLITLAIILLYSVAGFSQSNINSVAIDTIIHYPEMSSSKLFSKSKEWIAGKFVNPDKVVTAEEQDNYVSGKYSISMNIRTGPEIPFYVFYKVSVKDNKIRIQIGDIVHNYRGTYPVETYIYDKKGARRKAYDYMYDKCTKSMSDFVKGISTYIRAEDDW